MVINTAEVYGHISKWCIKKQTKKVKGDYKMIFNEISKNLKQIFRNWSSLILLILGPLALILIIGFTSAGETAHGVQIGITADNYSSIKDLTNKIEKIGNLEKYEDINECIDNLKNNKKHLIFIIIN